MIRKKKMLQRNVEEENVASERLYPSIHPSCSKMHSAGVIIHGERHHSRLGRDTSACMFKLLPVVSLIWVEINMAFTVTLEGRGPCIDVQTSFQGDLMFLSPLQWGDATIDQLMCLLAFSRVLLEPGVVWSEIADVNLSPNVISLQKKNKKKRFRERCYWLLFFYQESCWIKALYLNGVIIVSSKPRTRALNRHYHTQMTAHTLRHFVNPFDQYRPCCISQYTAPSSKSHLFGLILL